MSKNKECTWQWCIGTRKSKSTDILVECESGKKLKPSVINYHNKYKMKYIIFDLNQKDIKLRYIKAKGKGKKKHIYVGKHLQ